MRRRTNPLPFTVRVYSIKKIPWRKNEYKEFVMDTVIGEFIVYTVFSKGPDGWYLESPSFLEDYHTRDVKNGKEICMRKAELYYHRELKKALRYEETI